MSEKVPTLTIQTFVENSLKYAHVDDQPLCISIRISQIKESTDSWLHIQIGDNGQGYSPEILEEYQQPDSSLFRGRHVGLDNLMQRMELLYEGRAFLNISNSFHGGALSEVYIPLSSGGE